MQQQDILDNTFVPERNAPNSGLVRRLVDNCLRPQEQTDLDKSTLILRLEAQGKTSKQIAAELAISYRLLKMYCRTQKHRVYARYLSGSMRVADAHEHETDAQLRRGKMRRLYDANDQNALDYVAFAYRRHGRPDPKRGVKAGDFIDPDRAERMTKQVIASQGWAEPIPTHAKPKDLAPGVIQAQMRAMRAADNKEMVVRVTTSAGETVEIGVREQQRLEQAENIGQ